MVLLIHDDADAIAQVRRLLPREVRVASTVADAVAALWGSKPSIILLAPGLESGRGHVVLEERVGISALRSVPVLLLGEGVPGFDHPVVAIGDELVAKVDALAPPRSAALLSGAERALAKARDEAVERRSADRETAGALEAAEARLEAERAATARVREDLEAARRQLDELQKEHAQTQDALAALSREHAEAVSRRDALKEKLDAAVERAQQRSEAALAAESRVKALEAELAQTRSQVDAGGAELRAELSAAAAKLEEQLGRSRRQLETAREAHRIELEQLKAQLAGTQTQLAQVQAELDLTKADLASKLDEVQAAAGSSRVELEAKVAELQVQLDGARAALALAQEDHAALLAEARSEAAAELAAAKADGAARLAEAEARAASSLAAAQREHASTLEAARAEHAASAAAARTEHDAALEAANRQLEAARAEHDAALEAARAEHVAALAAARTEHEAAAAALAASRAAHEATAASLASVETQLASERAARSANETELAAAREELTAARATAQRAQADAGAARAELTSTREELTEAQERIHALESRTHLITEVVEAAQPLAIPRTGTVAMGELARLMVQLWAARADVRVDLSLANATRRLWLRRGRLVAAWSSLGAESISARARRDGLIDARNEAELREVRDASPASLLEELRQRGLIRRSEVDGLVQRFVEEIALEAFSEAVCTYRLHDEAPGVEVPVCEPARALPAIAAQALRRSLPWEAQLELLGGSQAVPLRVPARVDAETLGFSERERELLDAADGSTSIESLIVASGLKNERGYQALAVAKVAGLITVGPPQEGARSAAQPADADSLDAMYEQVQHADYFGILGLPRTAGAADVREARERLAQRFDPLRWSAHPDPALLRRAQAVFASIEEAAKTLQDDRLRAEYARHLD